jgi:hypothetical protein
MITTTLIIGLLGAAAVNADKDDSYYIAGTGNPNKNEKMYWKDAENVFQDLSKFSTLYVEFHNCAWTWMQTSDDDNDIEENDYWYMGKIPPMGANVAYSLYGSLKGDNFAGCGENTFINSFYTNTGFTNFARSMNYAGLSGFSSYSYDDDSYSSNTAKCSGGYGVGCDYSNGFAVHTYSGSECNPANYTGVKDTLSSLNSAMKKASCVKVYDSSSYGGTPFGTPLEVLAYSHSCFYQDFFSPDAVCPDPYGKLQYYQQQFYNGIQESKKQDPYQVSKRKQQYTTDVKQGKTLSLAGLVLIAFSIISVLVELILYCCKGSREEEFASKKGLGDISQSRSEDFILSTRRSADDDGDTEYSSSSAGGGYVTMTERATRQLSDIEAASPSTYVAPSSISQTEGNPCEPAEETEGDFVNQTWIPPQHDAKEAPESVLYQADTALLPSGEQIKTNDVDQEEPGSVLEKPEPVSPPRPDKDFEATVVDQAAPIANDTPPIVEPPTKATPESYFFSWMTNPWAKPLQDTAPIASDPVPTTDTTTSELESPPSADPTEVKTENVDADNVEPEARSVSDNAAIPMAHEDAQASTFEPEALPSTEAPPAIIELQTEEVTESATADPEAHEAVETVSRESEATSSSEAPHAITEHVTDVATESSTTPLSPPATAGPVTPGSQDPGEPSSLETPLTTDATNQTDASSPTSLAISSTDDAPKQPDDTTTEEKPAIDAVIASPIRNSEDEDGGAEKGNDTVEISNAPEDPSTPLGSAEKELPQMTTAIDGNVMIDDSPVIYESHDTGILDRSEAAIIAEYFDVNEGSPEDFKAAPEPTSTAEETLFNEAVPVKETEIPADTREESQNTDCESVDTKDAQGDEKIEGDKILAHDEQPSAVDATATVDDAATSIEQEVADSVVEETVISTPTESTNANSWLGWY